MGRDYKKETEIRKEQVKRFVVDIDKKLAATFLEKLNGKPFSEWVRENIENFLKNT